LDAPLALDARGRRPVRPRPLCTPLVSNLTPEWFSIHVISVLRRFVVGDNWAASAPNEKGQSFVGISHEPRTTSSECG